MSQIEDAFNAGRQAFRDQNVSASLVFKIQEDPSPTNWVKWWRCGYNHESAIARVEGQKP